MDQQILIVGAGAAGWMAARELLAAGRLVTLLEASEKSGGRICNRILPGFDQPVEEGAEFVHGSLPLTLGILAEAGIRYYHSAGRMLQFNAGSWTSGEGNSAGWSELARRMALLRDDMTVDGFLMKYFRAAKYRELRRSVRGFSDGFDLADPSRTNLFGLRKEWLAEEEGQFRIEGGYQALVDFLEKQCISMGATLELGQAVKKLSWRRGQVEALTSDGRRYAGSAALLTVPLSIWQLEPGLLESIYFDPALPELHRWARQIGFGRVIKVILQFREPFWEKRKRDMGFLLSDQLIPTWWTHLPERRNTLTAWIGNSRAEALSGADPESLIFLSLHSLSAVFGLEITELRQLQTAFHVANWQEKAHIRGGYSFSTLESEAAIRQMAEPIQETLFLAGEAIYAGDSPGTVEAALASGREAADRILQTHSG
jgi:monoamine oxidase